MLAWLWGDSIFLGQPWRQAGLWKAAELFAKMATMFLPPAPMLLTIRPCSSSHHHESLFLSLKSALISILVGQTNAAKVTVCQLQAWKPRSFGVVLPIPLTPPRPASLERVSPGVKPELACRMRTNAQLEVILHLTQASLPISGPRSHQ